MSRCSPLPLPGTQLWEFLIYVSPSTLTAQLGINSKTQNSILLGSADLDVTTSLTDRTRRLCTTDPTFEIPCQALIQRLQIVTLLWTPSNCRLMSCLDTEVCPHLREIHPQPSTLPVLEITFTESLLEGLKPLYNPTITMCLLS